MAEQKMSKREILEKQTKAFQKLGLNDAEIAEILQADKEIDQGADLFPLTAEQEQASKEVRKTTAKNPTVYNFKPREKKVNNSKRELIAVIQKALEDNGCKVVLTTNPEREFEFTCGDTKYKIVMSVPRK